jgi:UDP-glucose 4-epimerase
MKILLTGGAGYIGSITAKELLDRNHEVVVIDTLGDGHVEAVDSRAELVKGNIGDAKVLKKAFSKHKYDAVMHFAGSCQVGESVQKPSLYYENNVVAGMALLEAVRENKTPKFIFSSSCAVYGEPQEMPMTEDTIKNPSHPYGETKLTFERILKWYSRAYHLTAVSLRYFNAAGATAELGEDHEEETHLIPNVLRAAMGKIPHLEIYGDDYHTEDGTCIRDYIHVLDIAEAHILALKIEESDSFNLGNGNGYSVMEVIKTAESICGKEIPIKICKRRPGDPACLIAHAKKINKEVGWSPSYPNLEDMVSSAWKWLQNNPDGYKGRKNKKS